MRLLRTIVVAAACGLVAAPALAQESWNPYSTNVYREGPGFRLGASPLVLHPGLAVEGGYDTNVFYSPSDQASVGAGLLRLRAHIDLSTLPPQRIEPQASQSADQKLEFRFGAQAEYREYLSSNPRVTAQRSINLLANADLVILPKGPFTLKLGDSFVRSVDPRNEEGPRNFSRDFNRIGFIASYRPGTGRLEVGLGDYFELNYFENRDIDFGNTLADEGQAYARFRFLDKTIGSLIVRAGYRTYVNNPTLESAPIRVLAGVTSTITRWFGASANIGYGNSIALAPGRPSFNNVIANAEARFYMPYGSRIAIGYDRDFFDTLLANYYVDDKIYLSFDQPLIYRIVAHLDGGVRFREYDGLIDPARLGYGSYTTTGRNDLVFDGHAELNVQALSWLSCGVSYNLIGDSTNFAFVTGAGAAVRADYLKHSVFARVDIAY